VTDRFKIPFSPHDQKYWKFNVEWKKLYYELVKITYKKVNVETVEERDVIYDSTNGERIGKVKLHYFGTRKDCNCEYYRNDEKD